MYTNRIFVKYTKIFTHKTQKIKGENTLDYLSEQLKEKFETPMVSNA